MNNLRIKSKPPINHTDFTSYIYQCQEPSFKYLEMDWEFAVIRQGYGKRNFNDKIFNRYEIDLKQHYILIQPHSQKARKVLLSIDYNILARKGGNNVIGFGKADLVEAYEKLETV